MLKSALHALVDEDRSSVFVETEDEHPVSFALGDHQRFENRSLPGFAIEDLGKSQPLLCGLECAQSRVAVLQALKQQPSKNHCKVKQQQH